MFNEKLNHIIEKNKSHVCLGLDTDIDKLPKSIGSELNSILLFNKYIINATKENVAAYKINIAFYEQYGPKGWEIIEETLNYIPKDIVTIADAKRGDIGNTSSYYAKTFFETFQFDSVTVTPYMGFDSIEPFIRYKEKGTIVLVLTSNKGSVDLQEEKLLNGHYLFEHLAEKIKEWDFNKNISVVVGATNSVNIKRIRKILPESYFLVPGIGAQGGNLMDVIKYSGKKTLINSSRSLIYASENLDFAEICKQKTIELKNEINDLFHNNN